MPSDLTFRLECTTVVGKWLEIGFGKASSGAIVRRTNPNELSGDGDDRPHTLAMEGLQNANCLLRHLPRLAFTVLTVQQHVHHSPRLCKNGQRSSAEWVLSPRSVPSHRRPLLLLALAILRCTARMSSLDAVKVLPR